MSDHLNREVTRALPALAGGQLLLRTNDGREGGRLLSIPVGAGR